MPETKQTELGLYIPTVITKQGDGSYVCRSGKPTRELTPLQAAAALGISRSSVYALIEGGRLECRRPTPGKILISAESVTRHAEQTKDPEFWTKA